MNLQFFVDPRFQPKPKPLRVLIKYIRNCHQGLEGATGDRKCSHNPFEHRASKMIFHMRARLCPKLKK